MTGTEGSLSSLLFPSRRGLHRCLATRRTHTSATMQISCGTVVVLFVSLLIASAPMALGKGAKAVAAKSSPGAGGQQDGTEEFIIPMGGHIQLVRPSRPVPHLRTHAPGRYRH